jgi:4-carboxymuconolactone decarboxylase
MAAQTQTNSNQALKDLASGGGTAVDKLLDIELVNVENSGLDAKTHAMVSLAALVTLDASPASYAAELPIAMDGGVTREDCAGLLVALAPTIGAARVVEGAANIATVLGIEYAAQQRMQGQSGQQGQGQSGQGGGGMR